jgi:transposase
MVKRDGRSLDHKTLEEMRILGVCRVLENGEKAADVAASLGMCRTYLYRWIAVAKERGMDALAMKVAKGPRPKLSDKQCAQLTRLIVGKDPRQYGLDFGLWTRRIVAGLIQEKFGVTMSLVGVGKLLARLHITPQKPLRRAYERDPQAVAKWVDEDYPRLRKRAKKRGASIFFLDEAGFSSEPNLGRTWGKKGRTPVVKTSGQRQKVNAISAVNAKGGFWSKVYTGNLNAGRFVQFLKDFRRGGRGRVYLVVDGHPSHRAKCVQRYVESTKGMLELHFLPPYAPDLNPDEFVWQHAKTNGVSKKPLKQNESLRERVQADLDAIRRRPQLVRSFFCAPSVVYASY